MKITIEATEEMYDAPINRVDVPVRIWAGTTEGGVPVEAYILRVVPQVNVKMTIEATQEMYDAPTNGVNVPVRIWSGTIEGGVPVCAFVLAIVPQDKLNMAKFEMELAPFMRRSRDMFKIKTDE